MILTRNCTTRSRRGFTLVELMVAAALSITIMWILAESFKMGIDFARSARSTGDMMTQLNNVGQIMTRDIQSNHFIASPTVTNSNGKLTSQRLDLLGQNGSLTSATGYTPPNGYFQIYSPPPPAASIVTDNSEGFQINTVTAHTLQFTVQLPSGYSQNLFTATVSGQSLISQAAEVAYFLGSSSGAGVATGVTPPAPGLPSQNTFNLYRRQRLVAVTPDDVFNLTQAVTADQNATPAWSLGSSEVISTTGTLPTTPVVNTLASFANSTTQRVAPYPTGYGTPVFSPLSSNYGRLGDDIVLSNVLSFEVLPTWQQNKAFLSVPSAAAYNTPPRPFTNNSNYPYDYLNLNSMNTAVPANLFDTWFQGSNWNKLDTPNKFAVPMPIRITGLQITIRIYDPKTKQARQNSWRIAM